MQHVHLVVHHGVDGFEDEVQGQEVPGGVDHEAAVTELGVVVLDHDGQVLELAGK